MQVMHLSFVEHVIHTLEHSISYNMKFKKVTFALVQFIEILAFLTTTYRRSSDIEFALYTSTIGTSLALGRTSFTEIIQIFMTNLCTDYHRNNCHLSMNRNLVAPYFTDTQGNYFLSTDMFGIFHRKLFFLLINTDTLTCF